MTLFAPFTAGMVTDVPAHQIGPQNSSFAQDGFSPTGFFKQRAGWSYDGTTADVASNLKGIARVKFALADVTRTITTAANSSAYIHNAAASGTVVTHLGSASMLPRCVYNDELIICHQDGTTPIHRYSGAALDSDATASAVTWTADKATFTATTGTFPASVTPGTYVWNYAFAVSDIPPNAMVRVIERISTTVLTVEGVKASQTVAGTARNWGVGRAFPCVNVYDAGTGSFDNATNVFNGTGVKWSSGDWGSVVAAQDGLLIIRPAGTSAVHGINAVNSDTQLDLFATSKADTNVNYAILRNCPFKDAAAHKGSFWGTGAAQFPNRVYVGPPGWNLAFPPGFTLPFDPTVLPESENVNDFLMDYIDVPTPYDGDHNVAILSSPNPLLVLKRDSVHGIFGSYGGLSPDLIASGIGCIDIRSAQSFDEGQFWAGENGIFWYRYGNIIDITKQDPNGAPKPGINREWRALVRDFDYGTSDYCSIGLASGHLFVHITTGGGTTQRTYLCDLRDCSWQSRVSNVTPRYMFTSRISGENERLYAVSDARQGRVLNLAPMLDGSGTAKDDAGTAPRLQAYTTSGLAQASGIEGDSRLVDLDIHMNEYDAGAAGSSSMSVSVVSGGGIGNPADSTATLTAINSDTVDRIDRHHRRVRRKGRFHQIRFDNATTGTDTAATKVEINQIVASFRDGRERS